MTQQERVDSICVPGQFEKDCRKAYLFNKNFKLPGSQLAVSQPKLEEYDQILSSIDDTMDEIIVSSHKHKLLRRKDNQVGWRCDHIKGVNHCLSGMYTFYQSNMTNPPIQRWQCKQCDFDLCGRCLKADIFIRD